MQPREQDQKQPLDTRSDEKPKRFRIVKLEERIAPKGGKHGQETSGIASIE